MGAAHVELCSQSTTSPLGGPGQKKNSNDEPVQFPEGALFITRFKQAAQGGTLADVTSVRRGDT